MSFLIYEKRVGQEDLFVVQGDAAVVARYLCESKPQKYIVYPSHDARLVPIWAQVLWVQRCGTPFANGNPRYIRHLLAQMTPTDLTQCTVHDVTVHFCGPRGGDSKVPHYPAAEWLQVHRSLNLGVLTAASDALPANCVLVDAAAMETMITALQWYGEENHYSSTNNIPALKDRGKTARLALMTIR